MPIEAVCGSTQGWYRQWVAQNSNVANAYHTKSLADKVWWSRWREVEFILEGWAIAYRRLFVVVLKSGGCRGWQKKAMWQMHITPSLCPINCSGQGRERWNLC